MSFCSNGRRVTKKIISKGQTHFTNRERDRGKDRGTKGREGREREMKQERDQRKKSRGERVRVTGEREEKEIDRYIKDKGEE